MVQLDGLSSMATRQILAELATIYAEKTGHRLMMRSMGGVEAARLVRAGEQTDVVILAANVMTQLEAEGHLVAGSVAPFARSGMAVAVRTGARRPDISSADTVRNAMLSAKAFCYSTGPSGEHVKKLWERWGVAETIAPRALQAPPGVPVATLLARGEADLGVQQLSELLDMPGIEIVGPLPPEIQLTTIFAAGVSVRSRHAHEGREAIAFLTSDEAVAAKLRGGMEPALSKEARSSGNINPG